MEKNSYSMAKGSTMLDFNQHESWDTDHAFTILWGLQRGMLLQAYEAFNKVSQQEMVSFFNNSNVIVFADCNFNYRSKDNSNWRAQPTRQAQILFSISLSRPTENPLDGVQTVYMWIASWRGSGQISVMSSSLRFRVCRLSCDRCACNNVEQSV